MSGAGQEREAAPYGSPSKEFPRFYSQSGRASRRFLVFRRPLGLELISLPSRPAFMSELLLARRATRRIAVHIRKGEGRVSQSVALRCRSRHGLQAMPWLEERNAVQRRF
jgi:hypothetical protein